MSLKFFGNYLLEKGAITASQLERAAGMQETINLSFGKTAQMLGLLTPFEVLSINNMQRTRDIIFGDAAIELGFLDREQVGKVVQCQKSNHLYIGEALVKLGALDETRLKGFLQEFHKEQEYYRTSGLDLPDEVPCPKLCLLVGDVTQKMLARIARVIFKPDECQVAKRIDGNGMAVTIDLSGDLTARYYITFPLHIRRQIAITMINSGEEPEDALRNNRTINEMVVHFVTIVCDNIISRAAAAGIRLVSINCDVIEHDDDITIPDGHMGVLFPMHVCTGEWIDVALVLPV